jgi:CRP-like cAMP-binding protein
MLKKESLKRFPIFSDFGEQQLGEIAEWADIFEFDSNETICREGQNAFNLYGVLDGKVALSLMVRDRILKTDIQYEESILTRIETIEKDIVFDLLGPGEIFGWSALTSPRILTSTAKSVRPTRIFSLPAVELRTILHRNPQAGYAFMERLAEIISQRLKNRTDILIESWSQAFGVDSV